MKIIPIKSIHDVKIGDDIRVLDADGSIFPGWNCKGHTHKVIKINLDAESVEIEQFVAERNKTVKCGYPGYSVKTLKFGKVIDTSRKPVTNKPMTKSPIAFIIATDGTINAVVNNKSYTLPKNSTFYGGAKAALKANDGKKFVEQCNLESALRTRSQGKVTLKDGKIMWNGGELHNVLTKRIYALMEQDFPFNSLLKFLENTLKNPRKEAINELYLFLEKNALPITEDGCFLAWKKVRADFKDIHSGTFDNSPGAKPSINRADVDPNRDTTCSRGLHVCSQSYLSHFGRDTNGAKIVLVKVNPQDVCAVPIDYNNAKMRVCAYEVLQEVVDVATKEVELANTAVYSTGPKRDERGRFTK